MARKKNEERTSLLEDFKVAKGKSALKTKDRKNCVMRYEYCRWWGIIPPMFN